jgi:hypothetical protein
MVRTCACCGSRVEDDFRFCPGCGTPQRAKVVEYFQGAKDLDDGWLRVSAYLAHPQHVRFSIWRRDKAEAAMSLSPSEAQRLADFLSSMARHTTVGMSWTSLRSSARAFGVTMRELVHRDPL